ncbi:AsmA family protein [Pseudodesulfovibrio sp. JC047]|uniref:AsmA family protein n=1 Tax=Pseudodesulfovibrio sp. JC047 TaxID=2683199 RepID=UPI0013CF8175|nr:AsmA family protein [Pseudodesulfovibrio sp. JC047]NDV20387.1 AsmA family protein [Pseudodesulfovibrio sp. JC047]
MNKILKILLAAVVGLIALFIIAIVVVVTTVDPNDYKEEIASAVTEQTGRQLTFEGDIGFTFFPRIGLEVGAMALGNAKGFSPSEMVRIEKAEASIRLMPLLSGTVTIGMVALDGFTLNLAKNAQGITNWDDLVKKDATQETPPVQDEQPATQSGGQIQEFSVQGVEITNANIVFNDQQAGTTSAVNNLNLVIGEVGDTLRFPFELEFDLKLDNPRLETRPMLAGFAKFDQQQGTIEIDEMTFEALNLKLNGSFFASSKNGKTAFSGALSLAEASIRQLMQDMGMDPLETADPKVLEKFMFDLEYTGSDTAVLLEKMTAQLDDTTIDITGSVKNFAKPAIVCAFNIDTIDVDRYLPPSSEKSETATAKEPAPATEQPAQEPDLSALKELDLSAKLTIGKLKAMNLHIADILCQLKAQKGVLTIKPFTAHLYEGSLSAHSILNSNTKRASWTESATLKGVQIGPLLKDLTGKDHLLGTTVVNYDLKGMGLTPPNIKQTITGTASFALMDGAINGVNIAKMLRDGWNRLKGKSVNTDEPARTDFAELLGSAVLKNGYVTNDDLLMKSPLLRVTGAGWADLPKNTTDYTATVTVVGTLKGQDGASMEELNGLPLPIHVKGDLNDPSISLDAKAMAEALLKGQFKEGTKGLEDTLKKNILGGSESGSDEKSKNPFGGLF